MKKLTLTRCLTITVLLWSIFSGHSIVNAEILSVRFGGVSLNLPTPGGLCPIGNSELERELLNFNKRTHIEFNRKIIGLWIRCDLQRKLEIGIRSRLYEWVVLSASMSGNPPQEITFPRMKKEEFLRGLLRVSDLVDMKKIQDNANQVLEKIERDFYLDKKFSRLRGKPIDLGVLAVKNSIHRGTIITADQTPIALILFLTLIKGVPINAYHYKVFTDNSVINETLSKSKSYSELLHNSN